MNVIIKEKKTNLQNVVPLLRLIVDIVLFSYWFSDYNLKF